MWFSVIAHDLGRTALHVSIWRPARMVSIPIHVLRIRKRLRRNSGLSIEEFTELHNSIKRGDVVGVEGFPGKSRNGELSIFPTGLRVLSPCLHMLPVARTGLKSQVIQLHTPKILCQTLKEGEVVAAAVYSPHV